MKPADSVNGIVQSYLKPMLHDVGFRKKDGLFWRDNGEVIDVITVQKSQWNDSSSAKFTINLGLYWKRVQELTGRAVSLPREYNCTVQIRLGGLLPERTDLWWEVAGADLSTVGKDVTDKLQRYGLPWLEGGHSFEKTLEYIDKWGLGAWHKQLLALRQEGAI